MTSLLRYDNYSLWILTCTKNIHTYIQMNISISFRQQVQMVWFKYIGEQSSLSLSLDDVYLLINIDDDDLMICTMCVKRREKKIEVQRIDNDFFFSLSLFVRLLLMMTRGDDEKKTSEWWWTKCMHTMMIHERHNEWPRQRIRRRIG